MPSSQAGPRSLVTRGTRAISNEDGSLSKAIIPRSEKGSQPHESTTRALVLREAAWGKGELVTTRKISGQDKLHFLAEEMMTTAVHAPFRMEELLKMAESQLGVHLDEISNLKDPEFFYDDILAAINSRIECVPDKNGKRNPPLHDPAWVASVVGTRIHNVYTLAGTWRIIHDILKTLEAAGLKDADVREQLRDNEKVRAQYLLLYDVVTTLARLGQQRVANSAAASPHYASYFVRGDKGGAGEPEMHFDQRGTNHRKIREAHRSYIDAIILELVLPGSHYPPYILMNCLGDAIEECQKEEKRFTQDLWDAVGDLSVTFQVLDLLESPLLGPEGQAWIQNPVHLSKQFTQFLAAQASSAQACTLVDSWKASVRHLPDTRKPPVLAQLWNNINRSYHEISGVGVDTLWSLQTDMVREPQWSTYYIPDLAGDEVSDADDRALTLHKQAKRNKTQTSGGGKKQITQGGEDDGDYDGMPELMAVSDSSDDGDGDLDSEADYDDHSTEGGSESDFDPEEDEILQDMLNDVINAALDLEDLPDLDQLALGSDGDKGTENPFKRMFSRLKGRVFSANPALKATEQSRGPFNHRPGIVPLSAAQQTQTSKSKDSDHIPLQSTVPHTKPASSRTVGRSFPSPSESEEELPPLVPPGSYASKSHRNTIEEVEDQDHLGRSNMKKKKKKKKSKKIEDPPVISPTSPVSQPSLSNNFSSSKRENVSPGKSNPSNYPHRTSIDPLEGNLSRTSLPLTQETTAQSARSYLQSEHLVAEKSKVKSRPAFAGSFFKSGKDKKSQEGEEDNSKGLLGKMKKLRLSKRAGDLFSRLFNPADGKTHAKKPMKWEEFLNFMRLMGFSYDPSTAGSSVRFDPPDPKDKSITFHKPHPDPTLQRGHLRDIRKRLERTYGWSPEQFNQFVSEADQSN